MALEPLTPTDRIVNVYLNVARDSLGRPAALFDGYKAGDPLRHCFRLPLVGAELRLSPTALAEKVYHLLNVGDDPMFGTPDERAVAYRLANYRSLSVGDVLEIDGEHLAVASMGFVSVDVPAREAISTPW